MDPFLPTVPGLLCAIKSFRKLLDIIWNDYVNTTQLWERALPGKNQTIHIRKWKWIEHNLREPQNNIRSSLEWNPQGAACRARLWKTWIRTVQKELKGMT